MASTSGAETRERLPSHWNIDMPPSGVVPHHQIVSAMRAMALADTAPTLTVMAGGGGRGEGGRRGKVYWQTHASLTFEDDGVAYTARVQTRPEDEGTNRRKTYHSLDIVADVESSASDLTVAYTDDDYGTYTTWGTVDLSSQGPLRLTRGGAARRRAWALTHSANTPMRLHRAEGTLTMGTS